jgi:hypothetical protein
MKRKVKINKLPKGYMQEGGSVNKTLQPVPREEANLEAEKGEVALLKQGGEPMTYNIGGKRHSEGGTPLNLEPGSRIFSDTKKMKIKDKNILAEFGATKPATPAKLAKKYNVNDYQASLANPFADDIEKNTARMMIDKNEEKLDNLFFVQEAKKGFPQGVPGQQMSQAGMMAKYGAELPKAQEGARAGSSLAEREKKLQELEYQRKMVSSNPNLTAVEKDKQMTELNRAIAIEAQYIGKMRQEPAAPQSTEEDPATSSPTFQWTKPSQNFGDAMFGDPTANFPQTPVLPFDTTPYQVTPPASTEPSSAGSGSSNTSSTSSSNRDSQSRDPRMYGSIEAYEGSRANTPTGQSNRFDYGNQFFDRWATVIPGITEMTNKEAQRATYEYILKNNPEQAAEMWKAFGLTKAGFADPELAAKYKDGIISGDLTLEDLQALEKAYVDGYFGARQMLPEEPTLIPPPPKTPPTEIPPTEIPPLTPPRVRDPKPFEQDLRNERLIGRNRMSERLRLPWRGRLRARTADPTYQSDVQQQQNLLSGLNTASEAASTFGANPGAVMSNVARLSGLTGTESNKIAAALQRENTGIANTFEQFNAKEQSATDVRNMANAQDLYDNTVKAQEVFDEKMRRYNILGTAARNATDTNLARIKAMNKLNPLFTINTGLGPQFGDIQFQPGVSAAMFDPNQASASESRKEYLKGFRQQILEDPSYGDSDKRIDLLKKIDEELMGLGTNSSANNLQQQAAQMYGAGMQGVGFAMPGMNPFAVGINPGYGNPYMNPYGMGMRSPYGFRYGGRYDEE